MRKKLSPVVMFITALILSTSVSAQETIELFNGKDLSNWNFVLSDSLVSAEDVFLIKDGVLHVTGTPLGYMYTKEKYGNFKLHVEWRWPEAESNSGIFLLIENPVNPFPDGIECQLGAGKAGDFVMLGKSSLDEFAPKEGEVRSRFPMLPKKEPSNEKPVGEWNHADIEVADGVINVYINGLHQNKGTNRVKSGYIGLQSEGGAVEFRNVGLERVAQ